MGRSVEKLVLSEVGFVGELSAVLDVDPLGVGGLASGRVAAGVALLRDACLAAAEAAGLPVPSSYLVGLSVSKDGLPRVEFEAVA